MNMKAFTDIEQSKKLAEILPLESANGFYEPQLNEKGEWENILFPAWGLVALLDAMPSEVVDNHFLTLHKEGEEYCCCYENYNGHSIKGCFSDNPIDACVAMIEKLNELKML